MAPGEWVQFLWGYEGDGEEVTALVVATSRHRRRLTPSEVAGACEATERQPLRTVTWFGSTKAHREADCCECEPGSYCENGYGKGWVEVLLCAPSDEARAA